MKACSSPGGLFAALLALIVVFISAVLYESGIITDETYLKLISAVNGEITETSDYSVHFIDVGQAECILIETPDKTVLIDAGDVGCEKRIENYLRTNGIFKIDYFIATHPHADHIGSASKVLSKFPVGEVIMPEIPAEFLPTTSLFEDFLKTLSRKKCPVSYAKAGTVIELGEGKLEIIAPLGYMGENLNNYSVVSKFTYGETSFLFTGDIEADAESAVLSSGADISCTVYNAAHHGSSTSNTEAFLSAASPKYAAISCGYNNDYGHPHDEVIFALRKRDIKFYRTDYDGTIIFSTDGKTVSAQKSNLK